MDDYDISKQESAPWAQYAYSQDQRIRTIQIAEGITKVGDGAFNGCASLNGVVVPESVKRIGKNAFTGCAALEKLTIMNPECEIAEGAVSSGIKDGKPYFNGTICGYENSTAQKYAEKYGYKFESIGGKCGENAKWENDTPGRIVIEGTGDISDYDVANGQTPPWHALAVDNEFRLQHLRILDGITGIGRDAFNGSHWIGNVTVPVGVTHVGEQAFCNCRSLQSLVFLNPDCEIADSGLTVCSGIKDGKPYFKGVIIGFKDSTAQKYAEKYHYDFVELDVAPASVYPLTGMDVSLKLVPYLKADGYTEAEQKKYQANAEAILSKVKKITLTGDYYVVDPEHPEKTEMVTGGTMTLTENERDIRLLAQYDGGMLILPRLMSKAENRFNDSGTVDATVAFLDENGEELFRVAVCAYAWNTESGIRCYNDRCLYVADLSKFNAVNPNEYDADLGGAELCLKSFGKDFGTADYDCLTALGDTDGNGDVDVADAQLALKAYTAYVAGLDQGLSKQQILCADINRDNMVSVEDAQMILRYYTEKNVALKNISWADVRGKNEE